jgi:hypothetical protein
VSAAVLAPSLFDLDDQLAGRPRQAKEDNKAVEKARRKACISLEPYYLWWKK